MLPIILGTLGLALIYGMFWHNQPANEGNRAEDDHPVEELRAAVGTDRSRVAARVTRLRQGRACVAKATRRKPIAPRDEIRANPIIPLKHEIML
jgi:hypothetical protein